MTSEYWITNRGRVIPVNGARGHIFVIIKYCINKLRTKLGKTRGRHQGFALEFLGLIDNCLCSDRFDYTAMRCDINVSIDGWVDRDLISEDDAQDIHELLQRLTGCDERILDVIFGSYEDPREYGVKVLRWTRVSYGAVTVPELTQNICDNLLKIYDRAFGGLISIEVGFGGPCYFQVPKSALTDYIFIQSHSYAEAV